MIESSISLNRFTQPINKVIANKKSPHLIGSLIQTSKMKYSSPDKNWNQPPNSVENYNIKRDLYQYLSGTNQLKARFPKISMGCDLSNEFLKNAKKCLVKISSQKFSSERSLLFYSILNFIITDCCSRSITRILFSSFQRIGILLSNYYFSPFFTNINPKTNQVQTITGMVQKSVHAKVLHSYACEHKYRTNKRFNN